MKDNLLTLVQRKTFFGLPLYEKYRSTDSLVRLFAGGIWREEIHFSAYGESGRNISLFGLPLWGRSIKNNTLSWHVGRYAVVSKLSIADILERDLNRLFDVSACSTNKKRKVFVLWANSGEIAILFSIFMPKLLAKKRLTAKDVVFLCTKPYHADMASLYFPDIKAVVAKPKILRHVTQDLETKTWDVSVFFTGAYFCEFERQAKLNTTPLDFIEWMSNYLGIPPTPLQLSSTLNQRLDIFEQSANRKLGDRTDWSRTILISPASFSCGSLSVEDTARIHDMAIKHGFDVVFNNATGSNALTFPELLSKVRHSVGIIGIRSGLIDFLVHSGIPMFVIYRSFPDRGFNTPACDSISVHKMFSLKRYSTLIEESSAEPLVDLNSIELWLLNLKK